MTELKLLVDLHLNNDRQGPGSDRETERALDLVRREGMVNWKIADIGCGTGAQTMILARDESVEVVAVDVSPDFLNKLEERARLAGVEERVKTINAPMEDLPFSDEEFDLIWSEGAIYIMGFERGVSKWKKQLKPKGFLAVSELSWFTDSRPRELEAYWMENYPGIDTISNKIRILEEAGF
jgi:ubiquinone/menaquinone biosynthesis C-methylase UbiE